VNVLVTGANGFVGSALCMELMRREHNVYGATRELNALLTGVSVVKVGELDAHTDWSDALANVDVVVHAAARVHLVRNDAPDSLTQFRKVNVEGTLNLAIQAARKGIKRFVFLSSIKVNGEMTQSDQLFKPSSNYRPTDPYGLSKYEAEQGLLAVAEETGMEVVIIRPPLVYGVGVKANFASMIKWINRGVPLPFGAIHNQRSLVALDNLVSFIIHCIAHPKAANEVFLISDGKDISTTELLQKVAHAFGKNPLLVPVPVSLMKFFAKLLGRVDMADRLFGSLQVDSSKANDLLGWQPVITMDKQLKKMAEKF